MLKIIFTVLISINFLYAHPHTYINIYPTAIIKDNKIIEINFKWIMDEMTSSMLIMEFDQNLNGKIDKNENKYIKNNYFLSLNKYNFYTHTKAKYKTANFIADIKNNKIVYMFSFILDKPYTLKNFSMSFYDTDFFVATQLKKEFITQKINYLVEDIDGDFYYGYKITYK